MSFFERVFKLLLSQGGMKQARESLKRSETYRSAYEKWCQEENYKSYLDLISKAYHFRKANIRYHIALHLFKADGANGFAITYSPSFGRENFRFIFDYLKERVLSMSYRLRLAERVIRDRGEYVEETEKYYLKPAIHQAVREGKKANQQYGNITLEHVLIDGKPSYIKVLAAFYVDQHFSKALAFDDLIGILFQDQPL